MFGVIFDVRVIPGREDEAREMVEAGVVPRAKAHPGFLSGQWLRALQGDALQVVHLFDTEEHATAIATQIASEGPPPGAPVTLRGVETFELIAQA
jgi:hypothetical protein